MKYITDKEIAVKCYDDAVAIAETLMANHYVVMLSKEENVYIINYIYSEYCDRNDVVFIDREEMEDMVFDN
jgi:hypothetical protein